MNNPTQLRSKITVLSIFLTILLVVPVFLQAQGESSIIFPIEELGNCNSKDECKEYCDQEDNRESCFKFAVEHGLMTQEETEKARKFVGQTGPGGCQGEECRTYCENTANHDECTDFAIKNGFISQEEAERIKRFKTVEAEGGPGGCIGEECRVFCSEPENREECFNFAKDKEIISDEDREHFERGSKILHAINNEGGPGGCRNEQECRAYCSSMDRMEECLSFGARMSGQSEDVFRDELRKFKEKRNSFQKEQERQLERFHQSIEEGENREESFKEEFQNHNFIGPGECRDEEGCRSYCELNPKECEGELQRNNEMQERYELNSTERSFQENFEGPNERFQEEESRSFHDERYEDFRQKEEQQRSFESFVNPEDSRREDFEHSDDQSNFEEQKKEASPTSSLQLRSLIANPFIEFNLLLRKFR